MDLKKNALPSLSQRLKTVVSMVTDGCTAADIGCDHGYTAITLVLSGKSPSCICIDRRKEPLERAKRNICLYRVSHVETRLGDGLSPLRSGEAESIILSGMGGELICSILKRGMEIAQTARELILEPQSEAFKVRRLLGRSGFLITAEKYVREEDKYYPVIRAIPVSGADAGTGTGNYAGSRDCDRSVSGGDVGSETGNHASCRGCDISTSGADEDTGTGDHVAYRNCDISALDAGADEDTGAGDHVAYRNCDIPASGIGADAGDSGNVELCARAREKENDDTYAGSRTAEELYGKAALKNRDPLLLEFLLREEKRLATIAEKITCSGANEDRMREINDSRDTVQKALAVIHGLRDTWK